MAQTKSNFHGTANPTVSDPEDAALIARRVATLGPSYRLFYEEPLHPVSAEGVWITDKDGRRYLDVYNNVPSVGHSHPRVVEALSKQAAILNTHTRYLHETVVEFSERLLATMPDTLNRAIFTCTGSEANDLALRIANYHTGGTGIVVTDLAYHGGTMAVAEMSPSLGLGVGAHVRTVAPPDTYRLDAAGFGAQVAAAFDDLKANGITPSVLIFDSIFSSDGVFAPPPGVLQAAVEAAYKAGALVIADEVQPGFVRTGDNFWGFQNHGISPDIVTMGKPMGDGHPMAGLALSAELADAFGQASRYFNTFGGNPVSAAVGLAVLDVIRDEQLQENARLTGAYMSDGLKQLANTHAVIGDVRGAGLFIGLELVQDRAAKTPATEETAWLVNELRRRGVLISRAGPHGNVLKIRPPLPFKPEHADHFVEVMDQTLKALSETF
ncbi:aminotransferase class III-fold pyridoxal phosphate-dependent enzyme [Ruegeria sp.]|uniref:aspartate aminotransferase family protein n=1 Tax=Ruegeria sp. TaxID=1879320 RepID=UPI002316CCB7|nr:aminotransferase class III-fold pyridoxal phosphate-dependent enzyme [Ruegeria sp.]MDA7966499.1 aminotransferase class III-fold pyridoxal phosphate-dependent enzyme [Ruegeria sp.]